MSVSEYIIKAQGMISKSSVRHVIFKKFIRIVFYIFLVSIALIFLYPFLFIVVTSVKTNSDIYNVVVKWIPRQLNFNNFKIAYVSLDFLTYFKNSVLMTVFSTIGHIISCSLVAYGLARYKFFGKNVLFMMVVVTMIVPVSTIIIPLYMEMVTISRLVGFAIDETLLPIILPTFFGLGLQGPLFIFIYRQFYISLPYEMESAAKIDGCGPIKTFLYIMWPMSKAANITVLTLSVVWHWHSFYEPSILLRHSWQQPLPAKLANIIHYISTPSETVTNMMKELGTSGGENVINLAVLMAGALIVLAPVLIFFIIVQRQFMEGAERTGLVE